MGSPPPIPTLDPPWTVRVMRADGPDLDVVHGWMNRPHVAAFWVQAWPRERWAAELTRQLEGWHSRPCLALHDGVPTAYLELYRVSGERLADHYPNRTDDLGVHIAIGERDATGRGHGRVLLRAVAEGLLAADAACTRVVAEPDAANAPALRAFRAAGFHDVGRITLPHKTAALMVRPRTGADLPAPPDGGASAVGGPVSRPAAG